MTFQAGCLAIEARIHFVEALIHPLPKTLNVPLQAFFQVDDEPFKMFHLYGQIIMLMRYCTVTWLLTASRVTPSLRK